MSVRTGPTWGAEAATSAKLNTHPQGCVGRVRVTSNSSSLSAGSETEAADYRVANLAISGSARAVRIGFTVHVKPSSNWSSPTPNAVTIRVREDNASTGTTVARFDGVTFANSVWHTMTCLGDSFDLSGSHTYYLTVEPTTSAVTLGGATTLPGYIWIDDLGPAF